MKAISPEFVFSRPFETVVFAGGGNRCWWLAGIVQGLKDAGLWQPKLLVGASAGASIAVASVTDRLRESLAAAVDRFAATSKNVEWTKLLKGERPFALPSIYTEWIETFLNSSNLDVLQRSSVEVRVSITRPIRYLPTTASTLLALMLYTTEKFWLRTVHARLPHFCGLRSEQVNINQCSSFIEAKTLLLASSAAVPITPTHKVGGRTALDGGFYDSVPLPSEPRAEGDTLVLLTRHKADCPRCFKLQGRYYLQPSKPVPVTNMDCTNPKGVLAAFALGMSDVDELLANLRNAP